MGSITIDCCAYPAADRILPRCAVQKWPLSRSPNCPPRRSEQPHCFTPMSMNAGGCVASPSAPRGFLDSDFRAAHHCNAPRVRNDRGAYQFSIHDRAIHWVGRNRGIRWADWDWSYRLLVSLCFSLVQNTTKEQHITLVGSYLLAAGRQDFLGDSASFNPNRASTSSRRHPFSTVRLPFANSAQWPTVS
jgi:hypothetical protein